MKKKQHSHSENRNGISECFLLSQALGCMLYEMLCLKPAFDAQNLVSLFYKIVKADFQVRI